MGRWLAGRLMKELGLVSCQQPTHRYKRGGHEHVAIAIFVILSGIPPAMQGVFTASGIEPEDDSVTLFYRDS